MRAIRWPLIPAANGSVANRNHGGSYIAHSARVRRASETTRFKVDLPNTARALRSDQPLVVVAIGSSSTKGIGATDSAHAYPALLADELHRGFPQVALTVLNKGIGGERASRCWRDLSETCWLIIATGHMADRQQSGAEERRCCFIYCDHPRGGESS
jgi:hypothetical protein